MSIYYVNPASGSDAAAGTAVGTAWLTTQHAADTAVDGDTVRLLQTGIETITAPIDFDTNSGTIANRGIQFNSWNSLGTSQLDGYTIKASGTATSVVHATTADFVWFRGVVLDADSVANYAFYNSVDGANSWRLLDCKFKNSNTSNVRVRGSAFWWFYNCDSFDSAGTGVSNAAGNRGPYQWLGGNIYGNASHGIEVNSANTSWSRLNIYRNGADGINLSSNSGNASITNCTVFKNSGNGIEGYNGSGRNPYVISGNTFVENGEYGYLAHSSSFLPIMVRFNHNHDNTTAGTDVTDGLGADVITGAPQFTSTTDGSEDFTPLDGSPLDGANINLTDIGSTGSVDPSGGGGTVGFAI